MLAQVRERVGSWIAGKRAAPISLTPENYGNYFGAGIGSPQPRTEDLLRENKGVADIATRAIANRVASLNPQVKVSVTDSTGTLSDEVLDDHILKMLLDRPHPDFSKQQLFRLTTQWIVSAGDAYWLKVSNGFGVPIMLQPIPPNRVEPVLRGALVTHYAVTDGYGTTHQFGAREMVRFWFPDPETVYTGEGYLGPNATIHDAQTFANEHLRSRYQNDATPQSILKSTPDTPHLDDTQWTRLQREWRRKYNSRDGAYRGLPAMLPPGWDVVLPEMHSGADITPLLEFWQSNQLMNFGVPASVLGRVISGDRSSAETNQFVFDKHTILPIATMIQEAITLQLAPDFDSSIWVEFEDFVSDDKDYELKRERQDLEMKVVSIQQVREARGDDPEDAPWGELPVGTFSDQPYTGEEPDTSFGPDDPSAFGDPASDGEEPSPADSPNTQKALRQVGKVGKAGLARSAHFMPENEWRRVLARERKWRPRMLRAMRSILEAQRRETVKRTRKLFPEERAMPVAVTLEQLFDEDAWDRIFALRLDTVRKAAYLDSALEALSGIGVGQTFEFTPIVIETLREMGAQLVTNANATTKSRLAKALAEGVEEGEGVSQFVKRINEVFGVRRKNAETIARTELLKASQHAQIESFKQSGVVEWKQWNDNRDNDVRDSHVGSQIPVVAVDQPFILGSGLPARHPGDPSLPVGEIANCRCFVTPVFDDPEGIAK